jgi:hypothetical protein
MMKHAPELWQQEIFSVELLTPSSFFLLYPPPPPSPPFCFYYHTTSMAVHASKANITQQQLHQNGVNGTTEDKTRQDKTRQDKIR